MSSNLKPTFGLYSSVSIVVGGIVGSAIFMKPALMASQLGSPLLLISIWVIAGIITIFGALTTAEVASMFPETGGPFIYYQKMYGDFIAFMFGWAGFAVFNTAGVASIAYVFGTYVEYFIALPTFSTETERMIHLHIPFIGTIYPLANIGVKGVTIVVVMLLTWINYRSTRSGGNLLNVITSLKLVAMVVVAAGIFFSGKGDVQHFFQHSSVIHPTGWALAGAIVAATSGAFWGYDGWNNITFVAGEIRDPQRNIPRSLLIGLLICIVIYSLLTLSYLYVLPIDAMAGSSMVAADAAYVVMGSVGGGLIAAMVVISTFGTTHGNVLATARITFAMARQHFFFSSMGKVHPRFQTPGNALVLHGIWTSLLVLSGSFDTLTDMLIFVSWLFYAMTAVGIFILRKKMPDLPRPYKVWGYPVIPAIFVVFSSAFIIMTLVNDIYNYVEGVSPIINSVFGLFLTVAGFPLYIYLKLKKKRRVQSN